MALSVGEERVGAMVRQHQQPTDKELKCSDAIPDPGDRRMCEHKSSFQHPRLSRFCRTNYFKKRNINIRNSFQTGLKLEGM